MARRRYKPGRKAARMYRHYEQHGTAGMTKRQLRALAREMDLINPGRRHRGHRAKNRRHFRIFESTGTHSGRFRYRRGKHKVDRAVGYIHGRRNPKRDGTPTRGEKRAVKREAWLRTVVQRGKDAEAILSRVKSAPVTSLAAVKEHVPEALKVIEQAAPVAVAEAAPAIAAAVEHQEAAYLKSRISDLNELIADLERDIEKADAAGEDAEAEDLMEQKVKLVRQKKALKDKADGLGITLTNPGRRRNPGRGRRSGRIVLVGLKAYGRALRAYRSALKSKKRR
jgi:hypothetical protein